MLPRYYTVVYCIVFIECIHTSTQNIVPKGKHARINRIGKICVVRTVNYITSSHISRETHLMLLGFVLTGSPELGWSEPATAASRELSELIG